MNKRRQLKNVSWYFGGTIATAVLGLISTPLLTRVLTTEVYAQYGLVTTLTTLLSTFIYLGQDEVFMRHFVRNNQSFTQFLIRCMRLPTLACAVVFALLLEPSHSIFKIIFGFDIGNTAALWLAGYIIVLVLQRFLMLTARMEERAANYSLSNISTKAFFIITVVLMISMGISVTITGTIIALFSGVIVAMCINIVVIIKVNHRSATGGEPVPFKEMVTFGLPFAFSSTLFFAVPLLERFIIRKLTNWRTLAIYTAAAIFITVMNMIKTTINSMWIPYVYKNYKEEKFSSIFYTVGVVLSFFILCILAGTILTRRWLVLILDEAYINSYIIAPAFVCGACFDSLTAVYSVGINIKKKTIFHTIIPIIQMVISATLLIVCLPICGLEATGIAYLISIACSRSVQIIIALRYYGTGQSNWKMVIMMSICIATAILALIYTNIRFDICCSIIVFITGCVIAHKEILGVLKRL